MNVCMCIYSIFSTKSHDVNETPQKIQAHALFSSFRSMQGLLIWNNSKFIKNKSALF